MAELGLFPEPKILVLQGLVFLGALASANYFIISPALRLLNERKRRTSGAVQGARELDNRAEKLTKAYNEELASKTVEAKELRLSEVLAGQAESDEIISRSIHEAKQILEGVESKLSFQLKEEKQKLPKLAQEVSIQILKKLSGNSLAVCFVLLSNLFLSFPSEAAGGGVIDTMDGIVWPMFQFVCFVSAVVYFGRKTMLSLLEKRRDVLRTQLSEAKQAVTLAERRAKEYELKFSQLQGEIDNLRAQYVQDGIRERSKLVHEAKLSASNIVRDAQRSASELVVKAREEMRKELVQLAIDAVLSELTIDKMQIVDKHLKGEALSKLSSATFVSLN